MTRKERARGIIAYFQENNAVDETELHYETPFQLLVAVILSAQCTDKRVNMSTPAIFEKYPDALSMKEATFEELFPLVRSISYPNNKTKHLIGMANMLVDEFDNEVPADRKELQKLPGVGRKTANVIASVIYNQPAFAVDTHVFRVSKRLGLANKNSSTPLKVEEQLYRNIPKAVIPQAHHWLILHGRYTCLARKPKCWECGISHYCKLFEQKGDELLEAKNA